MGRVGWFAQELLVPTLFLCSLIAFRPYKIAVPLETELLQLCNASSENSQALLLCPTGVRKTWKLQRIPSATEALPQRTPLHISSSTCNERDAAPGSGGRVVGVP